MVRPDGIVKILKALPFMARAVQMGANRYVNWSNLADI